MKNYLSLFLLGLILNLIISSCSVEKRLYRDGFYVDRNKNLKTDHVHDLGQKNIKSESKVVKENNTLSGIVQSGKKANVNQRRVSENLSAPPSASLKHTTFQHEGRKNFVQNLKSIVRKKINKTTTVQQKVSKDDNSGKGRKGGIIMMILALILIALGYLFFTMLGVIGIILFLIFGIGGAIFFILGLIAVIIG